MSIFTKDRVTLAADKNTYWNYDAGTGLVTLVVNGVQVFQATGAGGGISEQAGNSLALIAAAGNINRQTLAVGSGVSPGATGVDSVLAVYSLPANFFDVAGRGLAISAMGSFGATANNKDVKIIFNPATAVVGSTVGTGGITVADSGVVATNNLGWSLQAQVFKYGAAGSNTQLGLHNQAQTGGTVASLLKPQAIAAAENAAILVAVTGNATTATSDIVFNWLGIEAMN